MYPGYLLILLCLSFKRVFVSGRSRYEPRTDVVVYVPFDPVFCVFNYQEAVRLARTPDLRNRPVETFLGFESVKINPNGTGSAMDLQLMLAERIEFNLISWIYEPAEPGVTSDARLRVAFVSSLNDFVLNGQLDYTTLMNSYSKLSFFNLKRRYVQYCNNSKAMRLDAGASGFCEILSLDKRSKGFKEFDCQRSLYVQQWANKFKPQSPQILKHFTDVLRKRSQGKTIFALIPGFHIDVQGIFGDLIASGHQRPVFQDIRSFLKDDPGKDIHLMIGLIMRDSSYRKWTRLMANLNKMIHFGRVRYTETRRIINAVYYAEELDYFPTKLKDSIMSLTYYRDCVVTNFTSVSDCYWEPMYERCVQDFNISDTIPEEKPFGQPCIEDIYVKDCILTNNSTCANEQKRIKDTIQSTASLSRTILLPILLLSIFFGICLS